MQEKNKDLNDSIDSSCVGCTRSNNTTNIGNTRNTKENGDTSNSFLLDPLYIDTNIIKRVGIDRGVNSIVVEINEHLVLQTIHLEDFAEKTIKPLKKQICEVLSSQESKSKRQTTINSIITCINRNIDLIKSNCHAERKNSDDDKNFSGIGVGAESDHEANNAQILVSLATSKGNTELFFKNQYDEPYVAVRLSSNNNNNDKHLEIMPLGSSRYKHYLSRLFRENTGGQIIGKDAVNNAINVLAANAEFDGEIIPLHLRVAWGQTANRAKIGSIYYDMTDSQWRIVEISQDGWRIINGSSKYDEKGPIIFKRHNQIAQVEPDGIYPPDIFDQFLNLTNIKNDKHRQLVKVYIISLFIPDIDHTILTLYGSKGAAKSFLLELIKKLVDPSRPVLLTLLKNIAEFIQQESWKEFMAICMCLILISEQMVFFQL